MWNEFLSPLATTDLAPARATERKRRQVYRGEVHGQLPFESKGMDEPTPMIEVSTTGHTDSVFSLAREDITCMLFSSRSSLTLSIRYFVVVVFLDIIDQIERTVPVSVPVSPILPDEARDPAMDHANTHPLRETRAALEKLISRMESLGSEFDKLVERSG